MIDQDKILDFLTTSGPTLPTKVAKNIGSEIFIASAHLSLLASQGKVIISQLKIGSSPLYYLPGQEDQLYQFAAGNINHKELQVLDFLRKAKVLREANLDLLAKVALRSLKDFATPLHVVVKGRRELFWRWHLLSAEETKRLIGDLLSQQEEKPELQNSDEAGSTQAASANMPSTVSSTLTAVTSTVVETGQPTENQLFSDNWQSKDQLNKPVTAKAKNINSSSSEDKTVAAEQPVQEKLLANKQKKPALGARRKERSLNSGQEGKLSKKTNAFIPEKISENESAATALKNGISNKPKIKEQLSQESAVKENQATDGKFYFSEKVISENLVSENPSLSRSGSHLQESDLMPVAEARPLKDDLLPSAAEFLKQLNISTKSVEVVRKNSELNLKVDVPSVIGKVEYFCKIRKKSRVDERDLSAAYLEAQVKKLPLLFLYAGQISKKAEDLLKEEAFSNLIARKID